MNSRSCKTTQTRMNSSSSFRAYPASPWALGIEHFPYRMEKITEKPRLLHLFVARSTFGNVELFRNGASLGVTQIVNGAFFDKPFQATGNFELQFDSNELDDVWIVVDWSQEEVQ